MRCLILVFVASIGLGCRATAAPEATVDGASLVANPNATFEVQVAGKLAVRTGLAGWHGEWTYFTEASNEGAEERQDGDARVVTTRIPKDEGVSPLAVTARIASVPDGVRIEYEFAKTGELVLRRGVLGTLYLRHDPMRGRRIFLEGTRCARIPAAVSGSTRRMGVEVANGLFLTAEFDRPFRVELGEAGGDGCTVRMELTPADFPVGETQRASVTYRLERIAGALAGEVTGGAAPLAIRAIHLTQATVPRFGRMEATVDLSAMYANPFDPDQVTLDASIRTPSGAKVIVPGFYLIDYDRRVEDGAEVLTAQSGRWCIRYTPAEMGRHELTAMLHDATGTVISDPVGFDVGPSEAQGFVRVSKDDPHYLVFDTGTTFFPIGHNLPTYHTSGQLADDALRRMAAAGENYNRWWMYSGGLGLEWEHAVGWYRMDEAYRLDHALDLAEELGLYYMLCFDTHQDFIGTNPWDRWFQNPYNKSMGGPCEKASDWFTSPEARKAYQKRLRYIVARYGYSPHVLAWEFGNEFEGWPDTPHESLVAWHREMGDYLKSIDPFHHMVTTSFWSQTGPADIWELPQMDIVQTHFYLNSDDDMAPRVAEFCKHQYRRFDKPHIFGEFGIRSHESTEDKDPKGWGLHNTFWPAMATFCAGAPMPWWHENYIDPLDLYFHFTSIARFTEGLDFARERFQPVRIQALANADGTPLPRGDLVLRPGNRFTRSEDSRFEVQPEGTVTNAGELNGLLHGQGHTDLRNPPTFVAEFPEESQFTMHIGRVSNSGHVRIWLDGALVNETDLPCGGNIGTSWKYQEQWKLWESVYDTDITIPVPAGRHEIKVDNDGRDWVAVTEYRFGGLLPPGSGALVAEGMRGEHTAVLWLQNPASTWKAQATGAEVAPVGPLRLTLADLPDGPCTVEFWETWKGALQETRQATVAGGRLALDLPAIASDIALKVRY
ncbi:MAG TPA: DUF5060 domain-containing protein [Armatimonadota bacterium]|mgnify:CR=1 FL=1|nr:DUF5060 domain-containing protein [Armatimonadota bacterium]